MTYDCRIAPEFIGVAPATLQQWLTDCQNALQALTIGGRPQVVSYAQGDGSKGVTYTAADPAKLLQRIRDLTAALGLSAPRRAIGVRF